LTFSAGKVYLFLKNKKEQAMSNDVFSAPEAEFLSFASVFNAGANVHAILLGIPAALVTDNAAKLSDYIIACHAAESPNAGKIDREDRKEKRGALSKNIRKIKNACLDPDPLDKVTPGNPAGLRPSEKRHCPHRCA
jgi:hypothetical protein